MPGTDWTAAESEFTDIEYWTDHPSEGFGDYALAHMNPEMLLGICELLAPETLVYEDRVYFARFFTPENLESWKATDTYRAGGMRAVQAVINHEHMSDLFMVARDYLSGESFVRVAQTIGAAWKGHLEARYPDRTFVLEVPGDEVWISEP